jgi:hypothetical protein
MTYLLGAGRVLGREELDRQLDHLGQFNLQSARAASRFLQERLPHDGRIDVVGSEPILYYLSGLLPRDRFVVPLSDENRSALVPSETSRATALVISPQHPLDLDQRRELGGRLGPPTEVEGYVIFLDPRREDPSQRGAAGDASAPRDRR